MKEIIYFIAEQDKFLLIILGFCLIFFVDMLSNRILTTYFSMPIDKNLSIFAIHRYFTYSFLHISVFHLVSNCWSFYMISKYLREIGQDENTIILIFLSSCFLSSLILGIFGYRRKGINIVVGASGGISAIMFYSFAIKKNLFIYYFFFKINAASFIIWFVLISIILEVMNRDRICHAIHLSGAFIGFIWAYIMTGEKVYFIFNDIYNQLTGWV